MNHDIYPIGEIQSCKRRNVQCGMDLDEAEKQYNILKAKYDDAQRRAQQNHNDATGRQRKIEELQYKVEAANRESIQRDSILEKAWIYFF